MVALYWQRWRIEDAFNAVKRLLGLAYFWGGSTNAVQVHRRGDSDDPVEYLSERAKWLGVMKRKRRPTPEELLRLTLARDA